MQQPVAANWFLNAPPWAVQVEALKRAGDQAGYGWWLEQGLGKTPLALNDFYDKWGRDLVDAAVVVCPNTVKLDWARGVAEWGIPPEHIRGHYWPYFEMPDRLQDVLLAINYEAASRPGPTQKYLEWLMDQSRIYLIVDETTAVANPTSQFTRAVIELAKRAHYRRGLNGTPRTRSVMDYWGQLRILGAIEGSNPYAFKARYAKLGGFMGKQIVGVRDEQGLATLLDRHSFRALKADWRKDLPPKVHMVQHIEMTKRQQRHYRELMEDFYTQVQSLEVAADMVLTQMNKLRQISSCLVMAEGKHEWIEEPKNNPKLRACVDWVTAHPGKAMVTAIFRPSVDLLYETFCNEGLRPVVIRGGMSEIEWAEAKEEFNTDPRCRLLVGQQSAVFRGHTLIGCEGDWCSRMYCYENSFSYYERAQLEDRIHRGAQQETCQYVDPVTSPAEERTLEVLLGRKEEAQFMDGLVASIRRREW